MAPPLSSNLRRFVQWREYRAFGLRLLLTGIVVLPLAACDDGSPSKADLRKVIANQARAQKPRMRNFSDDIVLQGVEVTRKSCKADPGGMYQCSMTVDMMGQEKTLEGVFIKKNGEWSELGVM